HKRISGRGSGSYQRPARKFRRPQTPAAGRYRLGLRHFPAQRSFPHRIPELKCCGLEFQTRYTVGIVAFEDYKTKQSVVVVYTGEGKGKTSAGVGLLARALGAGWKVAFIQFVKSWQVSEHDF